MVEIDVMDLPNGTKIANYTGLKMIVDSEKVRVIPKEGAIAFAKLKSVALVGFSSACLSPVTIHSHTTKFIMAEHNGFEVALVLRKSEIGNGYGDLTYYLEEI